MEQIAMFAPQQSPALPWVSAPVRIGKHDWRLVRVETIDMISSRTERYLNYQWSPAGQDDWRPSPEWPGDDINNGGTLGLPHSLARRLYAENPAMVAWCKEER